MVSAQRVYAVLGSESLWDVVAHCHEVLEKANIDHAIIGGVAVCLHGYQRNTVDVDLLVRANDNAAIRVALENAGYSWVEDAREFRSTSGIPLYFLLASKRAGPDSEVRFPDPADSSSLTEIEGLPVVSLAKLIESKLACGMANLRRTHRDFADVVELIASCKLDGSFARYLHKSVRPTYRKLVKHASG